MSNNESEETLDGLCKKLSGLGVERIFNAELAAVVAKSAEKIQRMNDEF